MAIRRFSLAWQDGESHTRGGPYVIPMGMRSTHRCPDGSVAIAQCEDRAFRLLHL